MVKRVGSLPRLAILLAVALTGSPAVAEDPAARCESAIAHGARVTGVPQAVLHAISLTETGRPEGGRLRPWPWAINREGKGHWFKSRDEALAFAKASVAAGRPSFDVSCFQINYHWHGANFPSLETMFDLDAAAEYAGRFLNELYAETGSWSAAAGAYHSRTPHYASIYRARFDRILADLAGAPVQLAEMTVPEASEAQADAAPRRTRTRMSRGPLIIRIDRSPAAEGGVTAGVRTERTDKILVTEARDEPDDAVLSDSRAF